MQRAFNIWVHSSLPVSVASCPLTHTIARIARIGHDGIEIGAARPHRLGRSAAARPGSGSRS